MVDVSAELEEIKNQIINGYKPQKIILFGSFAWGVPQSNSDVDLCIIKDGIEKKGRQSRALEVSQLFKHSLATDLVVYTPYEVQKELWLGNPFLRKIVEEGKILYDASACRS